SAARDAAAHGTESLVARPPADTTFAGARVLEPQPAARDELPDVFLSDPDLAVVREADESHVDLVEADLRVARGIDDGVDRAGQHEIRAELPAHGIARVLARIEILVLAFVAYPQALLLRRNEVDLSGV